MNTTTFMHFSWRRKRDLTIMRELHNPLRYILHLPFRTVVVVQDVIGISESKWIVIFVLDEGASP